PRGRRQGRGDVADVQPRRRPRTRLPSAGCERGARASREARRGRVSDRGDRRGLRRRRGARFAHFPARLSGVPTTPTSARTRTFATRDPDLPIGVFDSGVGGLTVLRAIRAALPHESAVYLGDTARVPYGTKSRESVLRYSLQASRQLV